MRHLRRLAVLLVVVAAANAATYTVDGANASASDANPGTASQPWKTIQKAANVVHAGDTVLVVAGTYAERPTLSASGASGSMIVFRSATRRGALTNGFVVSGSYVHVEGFHVGRTTLGYDAPVYSSGAHVELVDNLIEYAQHFGIQSDGNQALVSRNRVYGCGSGILTNGDDALIEGNEVERLIFTGFDDADYSRGWGTNVTFRGNFFHGTRWATDIDSSVPHIDGFQTFFGGLHHLVFEDNWIESFHEGMMVEGTTDATQAGSVSDLLIRNNVFYGYAEDFDSAWGVCIKEGTYCYDIKVYDNVMYRIHWFGAGIGDTCTGDIRDNIMMEIANDGTPYFGPGGNNLLFHTSATATSKPNATDILADPRFIDVAHLRGADGVPFTADDGVRLQAGSPAIDAGSSLAGLVDVDAYGTARPVNGTWDIGVQEYVASGGTTGGTTTGGSTTGGTTTGGGTTAGTTTGSTSGGGTTTSGASGGGSSGGHHGCGHGGGLAVVAAAFAAFTRRLRRR